MVERCYGREDLINRMLTLADERRCVLLFGGRQAGKTTMLRHAQRVAVTRWRRSTGYDGASVAVYVNLMALPYDAGPSEFYGELLDRAIAVCGGKDGGSVLVEGRERRRRIDTTDAFGTELARVPQVARGTRRVIFLLDEAGRVLGRRFPRAFQDNLFSMLYVDRSKAAERVALVFGGAQELAGFCEDETSPLGSRAEQLDVVNLGFAALTGFMDDRVPEMDERGRGYVFEETGGHAGLSARVIEQCIGRGASTVEEIREVSLDVAESSRRLFEHWMGHFSEDARVVLRRIASRRTGLQRREVAQLLADARRDRFGAERTWHELQYVGVCRIDGEGRLTKCNAQFWRYYEEFDPPDLVGTADEARVWELIRETEVALRSLVYKKYGEKWPGREVVMMRKALGREWEGVERVIERSRAAYPRSPGHERDVMECMYLGQLGALIESNQAWDMFKALFEDRREFGRMLKDIYPVRNDIAHFVTVPSKELQRCGIACDDVLVIVRQGSGDEVP